MSLSDRSRKTLNLSLILLIITGVHFFVAYQLVATSHRSGFNPLAALFAMLGLFQLVLVVLGFISVAKHK